MKKYKFVIVKIKGAIAGDPDTIITRYEMYKRIWYMPWKWEFRRDLSYDFVHNHLIPDLQKENLRLEDYAIIEEDPTIYQNK